MRLEDSVQRRALPARRLYCPQLPLPYGDVKIDFGFWQSMPEDEARIEVMRAANALAYAEEGS